MRVGGFFYYFFIYLFIFVERLGGLAGLARKRCVTNGNQVKYAKVITGQIVL